MGFYLYLIHFMGTLNFVLNVIFWVSLFTLAVLGIAMGVCMAEGDWDGEDHAEMTVKRIFRYTSFVLMASSVLTCLIPNKRTLYMEAGLAIGKELRNYDEIPEIMDKTYKIIDGELTILLEDVNRRIPKPTTQTSQYSR